MVSPIEMFKEDAYNIPASNMICIICGDLYVSLCPSCYKPLCMQHGAQAERKFIQGVEFCKGEKIDIRDNNYTKGTSW